MSDQIHDCREELRDAELKATPTRIAILRFLEGAKHPLDVATLQNKLKKEDIEVDPATIFRIVNMFTEKGIARQVQFHEGKARYELASLPDHHHLICENCGKIEDISDCSIGELEKEIAKKKKFSVKRHSLEFFGVCNQCQH